MLLSFLSYTIMISMIPLWLLPEYNEVKSISLLCMSEVLHISIWHHFCSFGLCFPLIIAISLLIIGLNNETEFQQRYWVGKQKHARDSALGSKGEPVKKRDNKLSKHCKNKDKRNS